jgi:hypothetical protein
VTAAFGCAPAVAEADNLGTTGGFTYVKESTKMKNGFVADDVTAKCPGDTVSVGGGSTIDASGSEHRAWLAESSGWDPDGWFTSAAHSEIVGKAKLTSWGICARDDNAIKRYRKTVQGDQRGSLGNEVKCKQGSPTGGGVRVAGSPKRYLLETSTPVGVLQRAASTRGLEPGWASFSRFGGMGSNATTTEAICLKDGKPEYPMYSFTSDAEVARRVLDCPRTLSVTGGGFSSDNLGNTHIIESRPADLPSDNDKVPDDGWDISFYNDAGGSQDYAIAAACR